MRLRWTGVVFAVIWSVWAVSGTTGCSQGNQRADSKSATRLHFEVTLPQGAASVPQEGRLFVVMSAQPTGEPRLSIGRTGLEAPPVMARDVKRFAPGSHVSLDQNAVLFPLSHLGELPPGDYTVQAVFATNKDLRALDSAGNYF